MCGHRSTFPAFDIVVWSRAGAAIDSRVFEDWISTLLRMLLDLSCFRLCCMNDSRVVGAVDLDACADAARHHLLSTVLYGAALGRLAGLI